MRRQLELEDAGEGLIVTLGRNSNVLTARLEVLDDGVSVGIVNVLPDRARRVTIKIRSSSR